MSTCACMSRERVHGATSPSRPPPPSRPCPPRYPTLLFGPRAKFTGVAKPASAAGAGKLATKHPEGTTDVMAAIDHEATAEKIVGWVGKQAPLSECNYTLAPKRELETQLGSALRERPRKGSVAAATMRDGETARMDMWDMETAAAMALDFAVRRKTCGKEACEYNAKKKKALGDFVQVREKYSSSHIQCTKW